MCHVADFTGLIRMHQAPYYTLLYRDTMYHVLYTTRAYLTHHHCPPTTQSYLLEIHAFSNYPHKS